MAMTRAKLADGEILVLRTCSPQMTSYGEFTWPRSGHVEAPDWIGDDRCGHGLHGLPWGEGGRQYLSGALDAAWLVVKVSTAAGNYRAGTGQLTDKCKFRAGEVVYCGDRMRAVQLVDESAPAGTVTHWASQTAGHGSAQKAGDCSTQTAGYRSTQTAGYRSTQTAGHGSAQKAGDCSTQTAGYASTQKAGYDSTQKAGDDSTQKAGYASTQKAGDASTQKAGSHSTQKAGSHSTQKAGYDSTQKAGSHSTQRAGDGTVQIGRWYDDLWHVAARVVTEAEADKWYLFERGVWRPCTPAEADKAERKVSD